MDDKLIVTLALLFVAAALLFVIVNIKSIVRKPLVRKLLGGAVIGASSIFGVQHSSRKKPETEKPSEPYRDDDK